MLPWKNRRHRQTASGSSADSVRKFVFANDLPAASRAELQDAAQRCRRLLTETIQPFYLRAATAGAEGYLEDETDGKFYDRGDRYLMMQSRYLWYFASAFEAGIASEANRAAAKHGFAFLQRAFPDTTFGGYCTRVDPAGRPVDAQKSVCHHSFALYALSRYAIAFNDADAQVAADATFALLEQRAHDPVNGGYEENFNADWSGPPETRHENFARLLQARTINTQMHLLEAFTEYARLSPGPVIKARIEEMLHLMTHGFRHPQTAGILHYWTRDWRPLDHPKSNRFSHGHDLELIWFVFDAARVLEKPERMFLNWAEGLARHAMTCSHDPDMGGIFFGGRHGRPANKRHKEWWAQAEALIAYLELYALGDDANYWRAFAQTLDLVETRFAIRDGGWRRSIAEDGTPLDETRAYDWQGPYHSGRAMLRCTALLDRLANA